MTTSSDDDLDDFLDNLGKKPNMQQDWVKESVPENYVITTIAPESVVQKTLETVKDNFGVDRLPPVGKIEQAGTISTNEQQKRNIEVISYALTTRGIVVTADEIWKAWPTEGDLYKLQRSGKRPSITAISQYLATDIFRQAMLERGVEFAENPGGLTDEQEALISILSNTALTGGLNQRLKKAGVSTAKFRAWKRQAAFSAAYKKLVQYEREDAVENVDVQLISMAQNGNLRAIVYLNELLGRGPNDKKAVDAMQFSKIILEAVMKHVSPDQLKAISAEVELASKQLGI